VRLLPPLARLWPERAYFSEFSALHDVSFEVSRGESIGIVGHNGAGKSTLLQLVCGTLTPTTGEAQVRGRVAALLELGSGFNPEYTGRENIFLNASVLGLSQEQTVERLDAILTFADIGEFVDQPVKTYSSGMTMRLAFAVIAHVDADVLIVDEALAVGDALFQHKCFRWLREFQTNGTVLYCGHDMGAILGFCQRAFWLDHGRMRMLGPAREVVEAYNTEISRQNMGLAERSPAVMPQKVGNVAPVEADLVPTTGLDGYGSGLAEISHVGLRPTSGGVQPWYSGGEEMLLTLRLKAHASVENLIFGFGIKDRLGLVLLGDNTCEIALTSPEAMSAGEQAEVTFSFIMPILAPGDYTVTCSVASGTQEVNVQHHWLHEALVFRVHQSRWNGTFLRLPTQYRFSR
jgi:lipopolysaccharide transport system ATP-binding protein